MLFVVKQQKFTCKAVTSDKTGPFGLHLNRLLKKLGMKYYVVQPQDSEGSAKRVKDNRLDGAGLCQSLGCYERVNRRAFSPV